MVDYDSAMPVKGDRVDGAAVDANRPGMLMQGNDGSNYQDIAVNSSGHVLVDIQDTSLTVNIEGDYVDDAAFTVASDRGLAIGGVASSDAVDSGDFGVFRISTARELYTSSNLREVGGTAVTTGSGTIGAGTLRVVLATDQPVIPISDNAGSLTVDATNLDIRDLTHVSDSVKVGDGTDFLAVNGDGSINAVVSATNLDIRDLTHASDSVKVGDGTDFLAVNGDGSINVQFTAPTPVYDYATANLVKDTPTSVNTYSPGAGTDYLLSIRVSGSGLMKVEILYGTTSSEAVIDVKFNSTANPNVEFDMKELPIASTQTVIVRCTNLENSASPTSDFSGYATIIYKD
jgi:hypothetical protein